MFFLPVDTETSAVHRVEFTIVLTILWAGVLLVRRLLRHDSEQWDLEAEVAACTHKRRRLRMLDAYNMVLLNDFSKHCHRILLDAAAWATLDTIQKTISFREGQGICCFGAHEWLDRILCPLAMERISFQIVRSAGPFPGYHASG